MNLPLRRILIYYLPFLLNAVLAGYLWWQLSKHAPFERDSRVFMFAMLYGVGGIVVAVSGVTAFFHATAQIAAPHGHYALSLFNIIVPTVLVIVMLYLT